MLNASASFHLDATETIRTTNGTNHDALYVDADGSGFGLVLPHRTDPDARVALLRKLSEAASDLADEINLRELEAAS